MATGTNKTVYLETFGCQMNELDSELVAGRLRSLGYRFTGDADAADVVLYNTCSVRERAEQKVWSRLGDLKKTKRQRPGLVVGVLGCMAERDGASMIDRHRGVDILCGPGELDRLPELLDNAVRTRASLAADPDASVRSARQVALQGGTSRRSATLAAAEDSLELLDLSRSVSPVDVGEGAFGPTSAYVRITRGCNKCCTYCVVPFTRGAEIHRPPEHIVDEIRRLADRGVVEITLLGQTVNHYRFEHERSVSVGGVVQPQKGRTYMTGRSTDDGSAIAAPAGVVRGDALGGRSGVTTFADLLYQIHERVPEIRRLRFVTSYPRDFGDDVLQVMRDCERICRYVHVPAQSGSDRVLKMMNRGYTVSQYDEFIDRCRHYLDEPAKGRPLMLSGDIIVGFPTETDAEFDMTCELLRRTRYKNCFIFKYSPRPGTVAYDRIADDVPEAVKRERNNRLLAIQAEISDAISREQIGGEFDVFVEGLSRAERKRLGTDTKPGTGMIQITIGGRQSDDRDAIRRALLGERSDEPAGDPAGAIATIDAPRSVQLSGRTDGDCIVFFDAGPGDAGTRTPEELIGRIVRCRITAASGLGLQGELVAPPQA